jgi:ketosteroid isomerase-like protein
VSEENVELVRQAFDAYASGGVDALLRYATPDCVLDPDPAWTEDAECRGRDSVATFNRTRVDAFGEIRTGVRDIRPVGEPVLVFSAVGVED